jgi:hypothetical protein
LKRVTDEAMKEYLERICDEIIKFQRTGRDLIYRRRGKIIMGFKTLVLKTVEGI